jgi:hypothetical protein
MATYVVGYEDEPRVLEIALLGYTSELSNYGLRQFADNNKEQIKQYIKNPWHHSLYLNDGTKIMAITYGMRLRGRRFDQLILFDDKRFSIGTKDRNQHELINEIKTYNLAASNVPEEYQILYYEDLR